MVTAERAAKVERAQALRAERKSVNDIAALMGISRSYASDLLCDPDRSMALLRRARYAGVCVDCGASTCGSDGAALAPKRCLLCASAATKVWTEEKVIAAIQHFAQVYGRRPKADDWIKATVSEDGFHYPSRNSVYRTTNERSSSPFQTWAEAIESAGFPRPTSGSYVRTKKGEGMTVKRTYLVFRVNDDESMSLIGEADAHTNNGAIELVAEGAGRYASCSKGSLLVYDLAPKLVAARVSP